MSFARWLTMMTLTRTESLMPPAVDSPYHSPEVQVWVKEAQKGDQEAFGNLVERFQRDVYGKVFSILRSHLEADDVVQETFLRVYRALPEFRFESSFRTWLITITTRQALNHLEYQRVRPREPLVVSEEGLEHPALRVEAQQMGALLDEESLRLLREILPKLPRRQREAITLKLEQDWPYERIAQEMGTSVGSVKAHVFHAIQNLTRHMPGARP